jgi:RNA polymerase sigma-70 factor (ECF subfamily)
VTSNTYEFQEIFQEFQPKLFRYFTRLTGNSDAEDLTQEAMVKISNGLDQFRGESSISTWIYRIATNVARDRFRSAAFKGDSVTELADEEELSIHLGENTSAVGTLENITVRKEMNT